MAVGADDDLSDVDLSEALKALDDLFDDLGRKLDSLARAAENFARVIEANGATLIALLEALEADLDERAEE